MFAVKNRKIFFIISGVMLTFCFFVIFYFGFNLGTDFKGGTLIEVGYQQKVTKSELQQALKSLNLGSASIRDSGQNNFIIRMKDLNPQEQILVKETLSLSKNLNYELKRFNSVGPLIGEELKNKALVAIFVVMVITILYIAYAFRNISKPISSWSYGLVSIIALIHDITIPAGAAVVSGKFWGFEIDALFVTALLSLIGYSINDTIIIFDRVRRNLEHNKERNIHESFEETVGKSLSQTYGRSINTSLTVFLVLVSLYFFAGSTTQFFVLTLIIGTIAGSYSSIFLAAPLLVSINNYKRKNRKE